MTSSNDLWLKQLAIIEEIAAQPGSSLEKLHFTFIEKLSQPPEFEHIDLFVAVTNVSDHDFLHYLKYIGRPEPKRKNGTVAGDRNRARSVLSAKIVKAPFFRQAFEQEYDRPPSEQFVQYYLQKTEQTTLVVTPVKGEKKGFSSIDKQVVDPQATVLKFRQQFTKEFGTTPSEESIQKFLSNNQEKRKSATGSSEMQFAATGANGSLATVLEFRKSFLQVFGKTPDTEMTKAFIAGLTSRR